MAPNSKAENITKNSHYVTIYMTDTSSSDFTTQYDLWRKSNSLMQAKIESDNKQEALSSADCLVVLVAAYVGNPVEVGDTSNRSHYSVDFYDVCEINEDTGIQQYLNKPQESYNEESETTLVIQIPTKEIVEDVTNPACFHYNTQEYVWSREVCTYDASKSSDKYIICNCKNAGVIRIDNIQSDMDDFGGYVKNPKEHVDGYDYTETTNEISQYYHALITFCVYSITLIFVFQCAFIIDKKRNKSLTQQSQNQDMKQSFDNFPPQNNQVPQQLPLPNFVLSYSVVSGIFVETKKIVSNVSILATLWVSLNLIFTFTGLFQYSAWDNKSNEAFYESSSTSFNGGDILVGLITAILGLFSRILLLVRIYAEKQTKIIGAIIGIGSLIGAVVMIAVTFDNMPEAYFCHWVISFIFGDIFLVFILDPLLLALLSGSQKQMLQSAKVHNNNQLNQVTNFDYEAGPPTNPNRGTNEQSTPEKIPQRQEFNVDVPNKPNQFQNTAGQMRDHHHSKHNEEIKEGEQHHKKHHSRDPNKKKRDKSQDKERRHHKHGERSKQHGHHRKDESHRLDKKESSNNVTGENTGEII